MPDPLQTLVEGPPEMRRAAIAALVADRPNEDRILERLAETIRQQAEIAYSEPSGGFHADQAEQYAGVAAAASVEQAAVQAVLAIAGPDGLLDDERFVKLIDHTGMLRRLAHWPDHVDCMRQQALRAVQDFRAKHADKTITKVKIFGLGGSGAPHDITAEIIGNARKSSVEIDVVHADEPNADHVDEQTLAIFSSFSGNTEETIHCYNTVRDKTPLKVALATGGELREIAHAAGLPLMQLPADENNPAYVLQPRESVCLQLTASLTFLAGLGLKPGSGGGLSDADLEYPAVKTLLTGWRARFGPDVPFRDNPAKQTAFFLLYGIPYAGDEPLPSLDLWKKTVPFVLTDRNLRAIGHEVRTQIHERSKLNAAFYDAPEFLHNLVESIRAGTESAAAGLDDDRWVYYLIRSADEQPRIRLRLDKTVELVMKANAKTVTLHAEGDTPYQRALFATYFNAHMTTYLALLNGFDPLPVPTMSWLKNVMGGFERAAE